MILSIHKSGKLEQASGLDTYEIGNYRFFLNGRIEGMITGTISILPKSFEEVCSEVIDLVKRDDVKSLKEYFSRLCGSYAIFIFGDTFKYLITDQSSYSRVYYYAKDGLIFFADSIWNLIASIDRLTIDPVNSAFLKNRRCLVGETYFKEIKRTVAGSFHTLHEGQLKASTYYSSFPFKIEPTYKSFSEIFENTVAFLSAGNEHAVALSGGSDSTSVLLALLKAKENKIQASTVEYLFPYHGQRKDIDTVRAAMIAETLGVTHTQYGVNFDDPAIQDRLKDIMRAMPFDPHLSIHWDLIVEKSKGLVWCGETSDAVNNFCETVPFFKLPLSTLSLSKRLALSKPFYSKLEKGHSSGLMGKLLARNFERSYHQHLNPPETSLEYLTAYCRSNFGIPFFEPGASREEPEILRLLQYKTLHEALFQIVVTGYIDGGDIHTWLTASQRHKPLRMPYSYPTLLHFFGHRPMLLSDAFYPKRFVYQYVRSNFPQYQRIRKAAVSKLSSRPAKSWGESALFKYLYDKGKVESKVSDYNYVLARAWMYSVIEMLEKEGVKITAEGK
ncbi:MAG: asparagine synthase-related protein [Dehalococcoidales bacterium]|nr:asparagine synthase-related protein [Dehalococcoidales bacterium]